MNGFMPPRFPGGFGQIALLYHKTPKQPDSLATSGQLENWDEYAMEKAGNQHGTF